jgi:hypothetical protein
MMSSLTGHAIGSAIACVLLTGTPMTHTRCTIRSGLDRIIASPKRLEISSNILAISALFLCPPSIAQEQNRWQFDSLAGNPNISMPDARQVHPVDVIELEKRHFT